MHKVDPKLAAINKRVYSQFDEDGVVESIVESLKIKNGFYVEFGVGPRLPQLLATDGMEANTRLLKENGWSGLWMDGNVWPPEHGVQTEWITPLNINLLLAKHAVPEAFDLISIDVDGQDPWIWMALNATPKIVVIECNGNFDCGDSRMIPFDLDYRWDGTTWFGASATAMQKIGLSKRYVLVWTNAFNCIFVREDQISNPQDFELERIYNRITFDMYQPDLKNRPWIFI